MALPPAARQEADINLLLEHLLRPHGEKYFQRDNLTFFYQQEPAEAAAKLADYLARILSNNVTMDVAAWWMGRIYTLHAELTILKKHLTQFGERSEKKVAVLTALCQMLHGFKASALAMARFIEKEADLISFPIETQTFPWLGGLEMPIEPQSWLPAETNSDQE